MLWLHLCHQNNAPQYYFYSTAVLLPLASLPSSWVYLCSLSPHDTQHLPFPKQITGSLVFGFVCVLFPLCAPNSPFSVGISCSLSSELRHHYLLKVFSSHPCPQTGELHFLSASGFVAYLTVILKLSPIVGCFTCPYSSWFSSIVPAYLPHPHYYPVLPRNLSGDSSDLNGSTVSCPPLVSSTHGSSCCFFMAPTTLWAYFMKVCLCFLLTPLASALCT